MRALSALLLAATLLACASAMSSIGLSVYSSIAGADFEMDMKFSIIVEVSDFCEDTEFCDEEAMYFFEPTSVMPNASVIPLSVSPTTFTVGNLQRMGYFELTLPRTAPRDQLDGVSFIFNTTALGWAPLVVSFDEYLRRSLSVGTIVPEYPDVPFFAPGPGSMQWGIPSEPVHVSLNDGQLPSDMTLTLTPSVEDVSAFPRETLSCVFTPSTLTLTSETNTAMFSFVCPWDASADLGASYVVNFNVDENGAGGNQLFLGSLDSAVWTFAPFFVSTTFDFVGIEALYPGQTAHFQLASWQAMPWDVSVMPLGWGLTFSPSPVVLTAGNEVVDVEVTVSDWDSVATLRDVEFYIDSVASVDPSDWDALVQVNGFGGGRRSAAHARAALPRGVDQPAGFRSASGPDGGVVGAHGDADAQRAGDVGVGPRHGVLDGRRRHVAAVGWPQLWPGHGDGDVLDARVGRHVGAVCHGDHH